MAKEIKAYPSVTLWVLNKHGLPQPTDGEPVPLPFNLEGFCKDMDCLLIDKRDIAKQLIDFANDVTLGKIHVGAVVPKIRDIIKQLENKG